MLTWAKPETFNVLAKVFWVVEKCSSWLLGGY